MRKFGSSLVVPLASFGLAMLLSLLSGGFQRHLSARQSGGGTGCTCTLKNLSLQSDVNWATQDGNSRVLTSLGINSTARVCASVRTYGVEAVIVKYTAKVSVKWSAVLTGTFGPTTVGGTQDMVLQFGLEPILPPCQPAILSATAFGSLESLSDKAKNTLTDSLQRKYPKKTVAVTITSLSVISNNLVTQATTESTCGAIGATMTASPILWPGGHRGGQASGMATVTTTVGTACP